MTTNAKKRREVGESDAILYNELNLTLNLTAFDVVESSIKSYLREMKTTKNTCFYQFCEIITKYQSINIYIYHGNDQIRKKKICKLQEKENLFPSENLAYFLEKRERGQLCLKKNTFFYEVSQYLSLSRVKAINFIALSRITSLSLSLSTREILP